MSIRMIWFDFGGVLSPPIPQLFATYQQRTGITRQQLEAAWDEIARPYGMEGLAPIELGLISQPEWGRRLRETLLRSHPGLDVSRCDFENYGDQWFAEHRPNARMIELLKVYRMRGFGVGILTNNIIEWERPWRSMVGLDHDVDAVVDSCKVGVRKPDAAIFSVAAAQVATEPEENLLIDDVLPNCQAARKVGWSAIHFREDDQVIGELRTLLRSALVLEH
jgi:putative hydrolase of the HAD superfamily